MSHRKYAEKLFSLYQRKQIILFLVTSGPFYRLSLSLLLLDLLPVDMSTASSKAKLPFSMKFNKMEFYIELTPLRQRSVLHDETKSNQKTPHSSKILSHRKLPNFTKAQRVLYYTNNGNQLTHSRRIRVWEIEFFIMGKRLRLFKAFN